MENLDKNGLILERIRSDFKNGVDPTQLMNEMERIFKIPLLADAVEFSISYPMVTELYQQINNSKKIWRYMDLMKFISLLNGQLFFARADLFLGDDCYEGSLPKKVRDDYIEIMSYPQNVYKVDNVETDVEIRKEYEKKLKENPKKVAISCWQMNSRESSTMWNQYIKNGLGVAVRSTVGKVANIKTPKDYHLRYFPIKYIDFDKEDNQSYLNYELIPFMYKRKEFDTDKEYRFMLYKDKSKECLDGMISEMFNEMSEQLKRNDFKSSTIVNQMTSSKVEPLVETGINVPINPSEIIEGIIAHPKMKDYEIAGLQKLLDKYNNEFGSSLTIEKSILAEKPY